MGLVILFTLLMGLFSLPLPPSKQVTLTEAPIPISSPRPAYPVMARAQKISGTVLVDVEVNSEGKVIEAKPIMGHELLQKAALQAARVWRFKYSGKGTTTYSVRLTFIFHEMSYVEPEKKPDFTSPYQLEIMDPKLGF